MWKLMFVFCDFHTLSYIEISLKVKMKEITEFP